MSPRLNVLLIEDNLEGAAYIGRLFEESAGIALESCAQLEAGLGRLAAGGLDAVLINLQLPESQGLNTLALVREANKDVPVVVLTTMEDVETAAESLRQGAQEFVIKEHLSGYLLQRVVQTAIQRMKQRKALEESEERARESDAKIRAILDASLDCIVTLDAGGRILDCNPAAEKTLGYQRDELVGLQMEQLLLSEETSERQLKNLKKYQKQGEGSMLGARIETLVGRADGTSFVAEMATQPVPLKNDLIFTVFLRDVTDRRRAEEELKRNAAELERSNRDLEQYASIISHDLTAPLRAITGFCNLLRRDYKSQLDDKADEFIEFIVDGAKRMRTLIDDLRAYSRVTTKRKPVERLDCRAIVRTAMDNLDVEILESGANVTIGVMPVVIAEKTQLIQLFQNLIANAIKYRDEQPIEINISADKSEDEWILRVRDNGIGFDPGQADKIFEIFQRLHADEEQYSGTGIGLAICKRIVQRHQGRIWAESEPGKGSVFTFTLPVQPVSEQSEEI